MPNFALLTIFECPKTPEPGDSIDGVDGPDQAGSLVSIVTQDLGFNEEQAVSSPPPAKEESLEDWETDDNLSPKER